MSSAVGAMGAQAPGFGVNSQANNNFVGSLSDIESLCLRLERGRFYNSNRAHAAEEIERKTERERVRW